MLMSLRGVKQNSVMVEMSPISAAQYSDTNHMWLLSTWNMAKWDWGTKILILFNLSDFK
jgi:hypothetical protein